MEMNSDTYFEKHFAGADILSDTRAIDGSDIRPSFFADTLGGQGAARPCAPKDIEIVIDVTLEELYNGSFKQVEYERSLVYHDAKTLKSERKVHQIEVKPGFTEDTVLSYKGLGNEQAGHPAANLIVKFKQQEHPEYKRCGNDLILTKKVTLTQAIEMKPITFCTLDGRKITVASDEQISPQTCKVIHNEGMPIT